MSSTAPASRPRIDWRTVLMFLPRRRFSAEELRRALPASSSLTLRVSVALNVGVPLAVFLAVFGPRNPPVYSLVLVLFVAGLLWGAAAAWRDPGGRASRVAYWVVPLATVAAMMIMLRRADFDRTSVIAVVMLIVGGTMGLWLVIVQRHQFLESRLREQDERQRAVEMARRLAAAQIEPHFLFNTLASLQHWVQTHDARAAPLLDALTGYLRATLPMFSRALHPLCDEVEALTRYLQVMQARLGTRLRWHIDADPGLDRLALPPGLLLTLVENAIQHGVEPQLEGGQIHISLNKDGAHALLRVDDNGPGPAPGQRDGVGLANCRERLVLTYGISASLTLATRPAGGCTAQVRVPLKTAA